MSTIELNENDRKVIRGIYLAVQERGEDYLYPEEESITGELGEKRCANLREDGTGSCIIGTLAVIEGLPTIRESHATSDASAWGVSDPVEDGMFNAQVTQDTGATWGEALESFDHHLRSGGITEEQINEIRGT